MPVFSGWDILEEYADAYPGLKIPEKTQEETKKPVKEGKTKPPKKKDIDIPANKPYSDVVEQTLSLSEEEQKILSALSTRPEPLDAVISRLDIPSATVLRLLTNLNLQGLVTTHPGKLISRNKH